MENRAKLTAFEYADMRRKMLEKCDNDQDKADKALDFIIGDAILPIGEKLTSLQLFVLRRETYKGHILLGMGCRV